MSEEHDKALAGRTVATFLTHLPHIREIDLSINVTGLEQVFEPGPDIALQTRRYVSSIGQIQSFGPVNNHGDVDWVHDSTSLFG